MVYGTGARGGVQSAGLAAGGAGFLAVGLLSAFDEAGIGGEVLDGGKASDVADFVEESEAKDLSHAGRPDR